MIVDLIAVNLLPISICESSELRAIVTRACSTYKPPGRARLTNTLLAEEARRCRALTQQKLKSAPNYSLTLECDGWTSSIGSKSFIAVVVTLHSGESFLLDLLDASTSRHTSDYLASLVVESIKSHELPERKLNCIVTDEASKSTRDDQ